MPADGFYEWLRVDPKNKQPFAFRIADAAPFAFAGLWDAWKDTIGIWLRSFSIITTEANELMAQIHNPVPVILHAKDYDRWLAREEGTPPVDLLKPFESDMMVANACNKMVGNVKNNGPEMLNSA